MRVESVKPYDTGERKREQIRRAFDTLAHGYDRLNRVLSLGIDLSWRRRALRLLCAAAPARVLDVATGTADFAILAARMLPQAQVTGVDLSDAMLAIGRDKVHAAGLDERINAGIEAYREALEAAGKEFTIHMYDGVNHAFNNDTSEARYDREAAELAWARTVEFLKEKLS